MASGCGYEIVRALENRLKAVLWEIEIEFCLVTGFKCTVKTSLFHNHPIYEAPSTLSYIKIKGCEVLKCHYLMVWG